MKRIVGMLLVLGVVMCLGCDTAKQEMDKAKDAAKEATDKFKESAEAMGDASKVTKDVSSWVENLTSTLGNITDKASAEGAVENLKESNSKLDTLLGIMDKLPAAGKTTIVEMLKPAIEKLKSAVDKVTAIPGVGDVVKPILDGIINKLTKAAG